MDQIKVKSEAESRRNLLANAKRMGCYNEILEILNKYEALLKTCKNKQEKEHISKLGCYEIYRMLGSVDEIEVLGLVEDLVVEGKVKIKV